MLLIFSLARSSLYVLFPRGCVISPCKKHAVLLWQPVGVAEHPQGTGLCFQATCVGRGHLGAIAFSPLLHCALWFALSPCACVFLTLGLSSGLCCCWCPGDNPRAVSLGQRSVPEGCVQCPSGKAQRSRPEGCVQCPVSYAIPVPFGQGQRAKDKEATQGAQQQYMGVAQHEPEGIGHSTARSLRSACSGKSVFRTLRSFWQHQSP